MAAQELSPQQVAEEAFADFAYGPETTEDTSSESQQTAPEAANEEIDDGSASPPEIDEEASEGTSEAESDEAGEEAQTPEVVEMEIDGTLYEIPVALKDHVLRQQDYTTKTQEVANQRKAVEVQLGAVDQLKNQYAFAQNIWDDVKKAEALASNVDQYRQYLRENIESLGSSDIEKIRFQIEEAELEKTKITASLSTKQQEFQQAQEQSHQELLTKGTEVLKSKIPEWGESHQLQVREYALSNGFTEQEIASVVDPRQVEVLWKARQYDSLKEGVAPAVKKVQAAPSIKPKSRNPMPQKTQDMLNLRKKLKSQTKSDKDKGEAFGDFLSGRFGMS